MSRPARQKLSQCGCCQPSSNAPRYTCTSINHCHLSAVFTKYEHCFWKRDMSPKIATQVASLDSIHTLCHSRRKEVWIHTHQAELQQCSTSSPVYIRCFPPHLARLLPVAGRHDVLEPAQPHSCMLKGSTPRSIIKQRLQYRFVLRLVDADIKSSAL